MFTHMKTCLFHYITNGSEHMFTSLILLYLVGAQVNANLVHITVKLVQIQKKIENFKRGIGIAEKSHETRSDRWGGNVNHKSLF